MGITARRQVQQNCFEGRAGPRLSRAVKKRSGRKIMLKLRAMGTTNDLKWFKKIIDRYDVFHVIRMSEPLPMKRTNKYYRMYIELDHIPQKVLDRQRKRK